MTRPRTVTITLTPKQREQVRELTGKEHREIILDRKALGTKSAPARKFGGGKKSIFDIPRV